MNELLKKFNVIQENISLKKKLHQKVLPKKVKIKTKYYLLNKSNLEVKL